MVVVFFIPTIRLLVGVVLPATNLALTIRGCLAVGSAVNNLVCCVAVTSGCLVQAIGTGLVVAVRIIATLLVVVVW